MKDTTVPMWGITSNLGSEKLNIYVQWYNQWNRLYWLQHKETSSDKWYPLLWNGKKWYELEYFHLNIAYSKTIVIAEIAPSPFSDLSHLNTGQC